MPPSAKGSTQPLAAIQLMGNNAGSFTGDPELALGDIHEQYLCHLSRQETRLILPSNHLASHLTFKSQMLCGNDTIRDHGSEEGLAGIISSLYSCIKLQREMITHATKVIPLFL